MGDKNPTVHGKFAGKGDEIKRRYLMGESTPEIASDMGCDAHEIRQNLIAHGVRLRTLSESATNHHAKSRSDGQEIVNVDARARMIRDLQSRVEQRASQRVYPYVGHNKRMGVERTQPLSPFYLTGPR